MRPPINKPTSAPDVHEPPADVAGGSHQRLVRWFVRGRRSNGTRWESDARHATKEGAEAEMRWWEAYHTDCGVMNVWREIHPPNAKVSHGGDE